MFVFAGLSAATARRREATSSPSPRRRPSPPARPANPNWSPAEPKTDIDREVPVALQTDAYRYSGLNYTKPLDMELMKKPDKASYTGTWTTRMTHVDNSGASFRGSTHRNLNDQLGNETYEPLDRTALLVSSDKEQLQNPNSSFPPDSRPVNHGVWIRLARPPMGQFARRSCPRARDTGPSRLGATTYDALYVEGAGPFEGAGVTSHVVEKEWLVKDIGVVKMEMG